MILVHGAPDRSGTFRRVVPLLADLDVFTYDRRGYGRSLELPLATSLDDHVDDLVDILLTGGPATLVGHSFGCNVVLATAIRRPDLVAAAGTWELPIPWVSWWPTPAFRDGLVGIAEAPDADQLGEDFARNNLSPGTWEGLSAERQGRLRREGRAFRADIRSITSPPYDIGLLGTPTVLACGATTTTGHREAAHTMAAMIGAPLMDVEGAGHFGPANHPEAFADLVRAAVALAQP